MHNVKSTQKSAQQSTQKTLNGKSTQKSAQKNTQKSYVAQWSAQNSFLLKKAFPKKMILERTNIFNESKIDTNVNLFQTMQLGEGA